MEGTCGKKLVPLLFKPVYKNYLWGGNRIATMLGRAETPVPCAESWELSAHPDGQSEVDGGPFDGETLSNLCAAYGKALLGEWCERSDFPLLVKIIDASKRLSVQVHPSDESAARFGGEAKTEMWYFLDAPDGSSVCAGLKKGVTPRVFSDAVKEKSVAPLLRTVKAATGKAVYIPGGLVHAICEGCFILEVQQSSNTTWRVYDWDRTGPDGKPRELHVARAMEVIDWHAPEMSLLTPYAMPSSVPENLRERVLRSDYFTMERWTLRAREPFEADGKSFRAIFAASGSLQLSWCDGSLTVPFGRTCLIPASLGAFSASPAADSPSGTSVMLSIEL